MKAGPPPELEQAVRRRNGKNQGSEIRFRCPYPRLHKNGDAKPSARYHRAKAVWTCDVCNNGGGWQDLCELLDVPLLRLVNDRSKVTDRYEYRNEAGTLLRRKLRWEPGFNGRPKSFTWEKRRKDGGWTKCAGDGNPKTLYHSEQLPSLREAGGTAYVTEGEKDADEAKGLALVAFTNPEGAGQGKWKDAYSEQLRGLDVVVLPDKDSTGRRHGRDVARSLHSVASSVRLVELPGDDVKDLSDWISAELATGRSHDEIRSGLERLVAEALEWNPDDDHGGENQEAEHSLTGGRGPTQSEILLQLADGGGVLLFHAPDRSPFASLPAEGHQETWPVESKTFERWLRHRFFSLTDKAPSSPSLSDALKTLAARAQFEGAEHEVHTRLAAHDGTVYLDLANPTWEAVEVTASGWRVVAKPPVRFRRSTGMLPLPTPVRGGSIAELRPLVNLPDDGAFALFVSFLVAALCPRGPYPVLVLHGEQGSAKSTLARMARALVDPAAAPLRTLPSNERDLMISATRSWMLSFDNLSGLRDWLSDAFCRLATGGGFATRELYSDAGEIVFSARRPVVLNGIDEVVGRQDLADRSLILSLPTIVDGQRRREDELIADFETLRPRLLGSLLDAVSCALRRQSTVHLESSPRMADFAHWAVAAEPALPWPAGTFLSAYQANLREAVEVSLDADVVATAVRALVGEREAVEGTCQELLDLLTSRLPESSQRSRSWPKSARSLSSRLSRAAPALRRVGIDIDRHRESGTGQRIVRIVQTQPGGDRHNRHDRHKPIPDGPSGRDADQLPVTVPAPNRHDEDAPPNGLCDGCDGRDGLAPTDEGEELRL